jgi:hypothetical protein
MMRPARQAKSCYRKVNEILTARVGWIARSERDQAHTHVTVKDVPAFLGASRERRRPFPESCMTASAALSYPRCILPKLCPVRCSGGVFRDATDRNTRDHAIFLGAPGQGTVSPCRRIFYCDSVLLRAIKRGSHEDRPSGRWPAIYCCWAFLVRARDGIIRGAAQ